MRANCIRQLYFFAKTQIDVASCVNIDEALTTAGSLLMAPFDSCNAAIGLVAPLGFVYCFSMAMACLIRHYFRFEGNAIMRHGQRQT